MASEIVGHYDQKIQEFLIGCWQIEKLIAKLQSFESGSPKLA